MSLSREDNGNSKFTFFKTEISFCPNCGKNVYLLTTAGSSFGMPSFYICFDCKFIGEIGVGKVREE